MKSYSYNSTRPNPNNISSELSLGSIEVGYRGFAVGSLSTYVKGGHGSGPNGASNTLNTYEWSIPPSRSVSEQTPPIEPTVNPPQSDDPPSIGV